MPDMIAVRLADPKTTVRNPDRGFRPLAKEGELVPANAYWMRRVSAGDVVRVSDEVWEAEQKAKKEAAEKAEKEAAEKAEKEAAEKAAADAKTKEKALESSADVGGKSEPAPPAPEAPSKKPKSEAAA